MNNAGPYSLTLKDGSPDLAIAGPGTFISDVIDGLDGMSEVDIQCRFTFGTSAGTKVATFVQTSLDQGTTWIDLLCFAATNANKTRAWHLEPAGDALNIPTDGELEDDTVALGVVLGDRLRTKTVVTGTYGGGAVMAVRANVR